MTRPLFPLLPAFRLAPGLAHNSTFDYTMMRFILSLYRYIILACGPLPFTLHDTAICLLANAFTTPLLQITLFYSQEQRFTFKNLYLRSRLLTLRDIYFTADLHRRHYAIDITGQLELSPLPPFIMPARHHYHVILLLSQNFILAIKIYVTYYCCRYDFRRRALLKCQYITYYFRHARLIISHHFEV
jgi:hypothetical protein